MKKFLTELFGIAFIPLMLVGDYLTHHGAFIFIYDATLIICGVGIIFAVFGLRMMEQEAHDALIAKLATISSWRILMAWTYMASTLAYLIYKQYFMSASLLIIYILIYMIYRTVVKTLYAEKRSS